MSRAHHILIVDDEPGTVRVLGAVLEDAGYRVDTASDGRAALEALQARAHDIVLLDFLMPHLDGCETLRAIKKDRTLSAVRVVMMSGVAESIIRRRSRVAFDGFLRKPFGLDELLAIVNELSAAGTAKAKTKAVKAKRPQRA